MNIQFVACILANNGILCTQFGLQLCMCASVTLEDMQMVYSSYLQRVGICLQADWFSEKESQCFEVLQKEKSEL